MSHRAYTSIAKMRADLDEKRARGVRIGVVPTMGALHEGHLSLVREAARRADEVVVTIFVNPTQFGPNEDFARYPRDLEGDTARATSAGATVIFAPPVEEMYPRGEQTRVSVGPLSQGMCGRSRPGHFEGVATVVSKLFNAVGPGVYVFGKKDYQQWRIVEQMARDLMFPLEVVGAPTVRESDGLALSSRNAYLDPGERARAVAVPQALQAAISAFRSGERNAERLAEAVRKRLEVDLRVDYVEARDPTSLDEINGVAGETLLIAVAGYLGKTRLIDNVVLGSDMRDIVTGEGQ